MKQLFILVLVVCMIQTTFAQRDIYLKLDKAENLYQKGKYKKALRKLNKRMPTPGRAGSWCGNALFDYHRNVSMLKANTHIKQGEYSQARTALNTISLNSYNDNIDSLRIITYQLEYGRDSLRWMFDYTLMNTSIECRGYTCYIFMPLSNGKQLEFKVPDRYNLIIGEDDDVNSKLKRWKDDFRRLKNIEVVKGKIG